MCNTGFIFIAKLVFNFQLIFMEVRDDKTNLLLGAVLRLTADCIEVNKLSQLMLSGTAPIN